MGEEQYLNTSGNPVPETMRHLLEDAIACEKCGSKVSWYGQGLQFPLGPGGKPDYSRAPKVVSHSCMNCGHAQAVKE